MTTYAVLGATGNCGTALIERLLSSPPSRINAFCRNKSKLISLLPEAGVSKSVKIFEGNIYDVPLITECVRGCHAVFLVISTNENIPGCRVGQDIAINVICALENLKKEEDQSFLTSKLILLSSATLDDQLTRNTPPLIRQMLFRSASNVYHDLRETEKFLRSQRDWVSTIFIKPGLLSVDVQRGHALSLLEATSPLSYLDLAAAMIEAADDPDGRYDLQSVGVTHTNGPATWPGGWVRCVSLGLLRHYFPFLHEYLPYGNTETVLKQKLHTSHSS